MFELLKNLRNKEARDRVKLIARYRELLELGDGATPAQIEELSELMGKLGYDSAKVEKDARAIANRQVSEKLIALLPDRTAAMNVAKKALAAATVELEETIKKLTGRRDELLTAKNR